MSAFFVPEEKAPSGRQSRFGEDVVGVLVSSKRKYLTHDIIQGGPRLKACGDDVVDVFIVAEVAIMPMLRGAEQTYQSLRLSLPLPAL